LKVTIALLAAISELEFLNINLMFPHQLPKRPPLFCAADCCFTKTNAFVSSMAADL